MDLPLWLGLTIAFFTGAISGLFGIIIGGASLITIPALLLVGLPPHCAVATNRLGIVGMMLTGAIAYHRKKMIDYRIAVIIAITSTIGAIGGAYLLMAVNAHMMHNVVIILTIALVFLLLLNPEKGLKNVQPSLRKRHYIIGAAIYSVLGAYGAFYGANVATFMIYVQVYLFGKTFLDGAATISIAMSAFSIIAAGIYMAHGIINYPYAIAMFTGMALGSLISAHNAEKISNKWLRRAILAMTIIMVIILLKR